MNIQRFSPLIFFLDMCFVFCSFYVFSIGFQTLACIIWRACSKDCWVSSPLSPKFLWKAPAGVLRLLLAPTETAGGLRHVILCALVGLEWDLKVCMSKVIWFCGVRTPALQYCEIGCGPERRADRKLLTLLVTKKFLDSWRPRLHRGWASQARACNRIPFL